MGSLVEALDDENLFVVDAASESLTFASQSAPTLITALFDNPKPNVRYYAAYAFTLEPKNGKVAVPGLVKLLKDPEEKVKCRAIASLGVIGADARNALPALRELAQDANPRIQRRAQEAVRLIERKAK